MKAHRCSINNKKYCKAVFHVCVSYNSSTLRFVRSPNFRLPTNAECKLAVYVLQLKDENYFRIESFN